MKVAVISFTKKGSILCHTLIKGLLIWKYDCIGYMQDRFLSEIEDKTRLCVLRTSVGEWTRQQFASVDGIIFVGAAGIAVRAIAPFLKDKMIDPAIVVIDELGRFSISMLSGHVGGANDLTQIVAQIVGAEPVITTATDINQCFAVDVFAKVNNLWISDRYLAKQISADLLEHSQVGFYSDFPVEGVLPIGLSEGEENKKDESEGEMDGENSRKRLTKERTGKRGIWITVKSQRDSNLCSEFPKVNAMELLRLVPPILVIGVGCRKGSSKEEILALVKEMMDGQNLDMAAIACIASITVKKEEPGLIAFAEMTGVKLKTYSAKELSEQSGNFTDSEFVRKTVGVGNVCERAALLAAGEENGKGQLLVKKQMKHGVTAALAVKSWSVWMKEGMRDD